MREVSLRELARGRPGADRIALLSIWFHGHNNPRYAELLPRLDRLDACLLRLPDSRIPRGLGFRAFSVTKPLLLTGVLGRADSRYPNLLSLDFDQLPRWHGAAVMDADDPTFSPREIRQMQSPAVRAYVVTAETAARRYESLGVTKPWTVIPQGVNVDYFVASTMNWVQASIGFNTWLAERLGLEVEVDSVGQSDNGGDDDADGSGENGGNGGNGENDD